MPVKMDKPGPSYRAPTELVAWRVPVPLLRQVEEYAQRTFITRSAAMNQLLSYGLQHRPEVRTVLHGEPEQKKNRASDVRLFQQIGALPEDGGCDYNFKGWPDALVGLIGFEPAPHGYYPSDGQQDQAYSHLLRIYGFKGLRSKPSHKVPPPHPLPASLQECELPPDQWTYAAHLDDEGNPITE